MTFENSEIEIEMKPEEHGENNILILYSKIKMILEENKLTIISWAKYIYEKYCEKIIKRFEEKEERQRFENLVGCLVQRRNLEDNSGRNQKELMEDIVNLFSIHLRFLSHENNLFNSLTQCFIFIMIAYGREFRKYDQSILPNEVPKLILVLYKLYDFHKDLNALFIDEENSLTTLDLLNLDQSVTKEESTNFNSNHSLLYSQDGYNEMNDYSNVNQYVLERQETNNIPFYWNTYLPFLNEHCQSLNNINDSEYACYIINIENDSSPHIVSWTLCRWMVWIWSCSKLVWLWPLTW